MLLNHFLLLRVNIKYDWREMVSVNVFVPQTVLRDYPPPVGCRKNSSLNLAFLLSFIFSPLSLNFLFQIKRIILCYHLSLFA